MSQLPSAEPGNIQVVLNLGGESEVADAIDINSLVFPLREPGRWIRPGRFIQADMSALPIRAGVALEVMGRRLPMMSAQDRVAMVGESRRVLTTGGRIRLHATSGGGSLWLSFIEDAGFLGCSLISGYAVGTRP